MNLRSILSFNRILEALFLSILLATPAGARQQSMARVPQHFIFSSEEDFENPVSLSAEAKKALATDESIAAALKEANLSAETIPENWFTAAAVHLSDSGRHDLVVMGDRIGRGAYTSKFLVLKASEAGYQVVFQTDAHSLELLPEKSKGFCNLLTAVVTLRYNSTDEYRFDGTRYKLARRTLQPNGLEVAVDPTKFRNRKLFVQTRRQDSESVRAEARVWIWQQWQAHRACYVRVGTKDEDGESDSITYAIEKDQNGTWQITVKSLRRQWEPNSRDEHRYIIEKEELVIATKIERIEPVQDESQSPRPIPDGDTKPASAYQLNFVDDPFSVFVL